MKIYALFISIPLSIGLCANAFADAAKPSKAKPQEAHQPAQSAQPKQPAQQKVEYADLGHYVGKHITVHTTLNTVRSGTLIRYSNTEVDLKTEAGVQLTLPSDTIRSISAPMPAPDPLFPGKGGSSGH